MRVFHNNQSKPHFAPTGITKNLWEKKKRKKQHVFKKKWRVLLSF